MTPTAKTVFVRKELFARFFKPNILSKLLLGNTMIERIDRRNKVVFFSTFIGYPESGSGSLAKYSVGLDGKLLAITVKEAIFGE